MELLRGESLGDRLLRDTSLSLGQATAILARVVSAVQAAHAAGIVHRDLKPDNIFLTIGEDGCTDVRVLDFGVAKQYSAIGEKLTETGTLVGTPLYMSPEQAAGERLDPRTDVWSLSVIAYECLTGHMPATGENYGQVLARLIRGDVKKLAEAQLPLPPDVIEAVDGALVDRKRRPDFAHLREVLEKYRDPEIEGPPETTGVKSGGRVAKLPLLNTALSTSTNLPTALITSTSVMPGRAPAPRPRSPRVVAALAIFLPMFVIGIVAIRLSRTKTHEAAASTSPSAQEPIPVATTSAPVVPPPAPSALPSAEPSVPSAAPSHSARPKASSAAPPPPPPRAASATRLQGGVGATVPF
jgi:serine/threonine-protein kinase